MYPPCNELGLLFITRAVFSNALLKTAAHFCPLVKCFLLFSKETVKRKIPRTFLWYEVSFLSSYLNDIGLTAGLFLVRLKGLEPTHISVREPKSRMSTNSITGAKENPAAAAAGCGAGNEARTRYLHLGKVALYRMS